MKSGKVMQDNPFLNALHEIVVSLDTELRIQSANRAYGEALGADPKDLGGTPCYGVWGRNRPCEECPVQEVLHSGQPREGEMASPDGRHWLVRAHPLFSRDGQLEGAVEACLEITEHKRLQHEARERTKELGCLHSLTKLNENPDVELPELLQGVVNLIPPSWQHPDRTCARIRLENEEYTTENFRETSLKQSASIFAFGEEIGHIEVCCLQHPHRMHREPFLEEEKKLLETIAESVSKISEQKRAEEALRSSERYYRTVFETTGTATIIIDEDTTISRVNSDFEALCGYSRKDVEGKKSWTEFIPPDDAERMLEYHYLRRRDPEAPPRQYEFRFLDQSGREHHILASVDLIRETGQSVASFVDVTEQNRAHSKLLAAHDKLDTLVELNVDGIMVLDRQGEILFVNPAAAEMLGQSRYELLGCQFGYPVALERSTEIELLSSSGESTIVELRTRRTKWEERDAILASFRDITDRKRAEEEVEHLNQTLRAVRNVNQLITVSKDRNQLIQSACDIFIETLGVDNVWIALLDGLGRIASFAESGQNLIQPSLPEDCRQSNLPFCSREALARSDLVFVQHPSSTCKECPISENHANNAGIAVPLQHMSTVYGVLSLSLPDRAATQEELALVREVGEDLGFALYSIKSEEERIKHESEREITLRLLRHLHRSSSVWELVSEVTGLLKEWSGCEAVGIRLVSGESFPCYETRGFPREHLWLENSLCGGVAEGEAVRDFEGAPAVECMCGNVLKGRFDSEQPFFTENGSFWTNSTTDLLTSTSEEDRQVRTWNQCLGQGYESVVLIPLRHGEQTLGLLQFKDSRRRQFSERCLHLLERISENLALGLAQRQAEDGLREREYLFRQLFEQAAIGIFISNVEHSVIEVNQTAQSLLGYSREELLGMSAFDILHPEDIRDNSPEDNVQRLLSGETVDTERRFLTKDGEYIHALINMGKLPYYSEEASHMVMFQDISERKRMEKRLREMSLYDSLTGLYNRNFFEAEMERLSDGRYMPVGILVCDLDGLKFVNDTLGHQSGDRMLTHIAEILQQNFRSSDIIARIGGDEFAVLLPSLGERQMRIIVERLRRAIEEHNESTQWMPLSLSIGYAENESKDQDMQALFREADNRMYREKLQKERSGRSAVVEGLVQAIEARDFVTEGHCDRMQELAASLARELDLSESRINDLYLFSRFHDLGKVGIPDRILFKPGRLTEEEFEEMKRHCEIGHRIAQSVSDLAPIANLILKHHERWDGQGYPLGLSGEDIPLECRILAITDAYDAMTNDRPYRKAMSPEEAIAELRKWSGAQFDPDLVDRFIRLMRGAERQ